MAKISAENPNQKSQGNFWSKKIPKKFCSWANKKNLMLQVKLAGYNNFGHKKFNPEVSDQQPYTIKHYSTPLVTLPLPRKLFR